MKQNFSNRLAAGGYWALVIAEMSRQAGDMLRERGLTVPIADGEPYQVYITCGVGAFNHVVNQYMPRGMKLNAVLEFTKLYDRKGQQITMERWQELQNDRAYSRVAMWSNGSRSVATLWTGGCDCPKHHLFDTVVLGGDHPHVIRSSTELEALDVHHALVAAVMSGRL